MESVDDRDSSEDLVDLDCNDMYDMKNNTDYNYWVITIVYRA
jgi:hypothetical protein